MHGLQEPIICAVAQVVSRTTLPQASANPTLPLSSNSNTLNSSETQDETTWMDQTNASVFKVLPTIISKASDKGDSVVGKFELISFTQKAAWNLPLLRMFFLLLTLILVCSVLLIVGKAAVYFEKGCTRSFGVDSRLDSILILGQLRPIGSDHASFIHYIV